MLRRRSSAAQKAECRFVGRAVDGLNWAGTLGQKRYRRTKSEGVETRVDWVGRVGQMAGARWVQCQVTWGVARRYENGLAGTVGAVFFGCSAERVRKVVEPGLVSRVLVAFVLAGSSGQKTCLLAQIFLINGRLVHRVR